MCKRLYCMHSFRGVTSNTNWEWNIISYSSQCIHTYKTYLQGDKCHNTNIHTRTLVCRIRRDEETAADMKQMTMCVWSEWAREKDPRWKVKFLVNNCNKTQRKRRRGSSASTCAEKQIVTIAPLWPSLLWWDEYFLYSIFPFPTCSF